jgi:hypothetical protein
MKLQFEGWYYKHQANGKSLAIIPGRASDAAFVLIITDKKSYHIRYPLSEYQYGEPLRVGDNTFSANGIVLNIQHPTLNLTGKITYTDLKTIDGDIMGPFQFFPMECRHGIVSMQHILHGQIVLDGEVYDYTGGKGYIESDCGRSFPQAYTWVQCNDFRQDCSIMVSIAKIPFYGIKFWGCIGVVWLNGQVYRLATYKGVKILHCEPGVIKLKQGQYRLDITISPQTMHKLPAPRIGLMSHHIREGLSCPAHFRFTAGGNCLLDEGSQVASYEYEMGEVKI